MKAQAEFDYIIIGAGSAGCVLAARLTEDPALRVLLIEAGPISASPLLDDPKNWLKLSTSDLVWPDTGTPQPHANGKQLATGQGKLVGGSSAINAMIHHRPTPQDIDDWQLAAWGWTDLLPMFKRSETWTGPASPERGDAGPTQVMPLPDPPPLAQAALSACEHLGLGRSDDINGHKQMGGAINQLAFNGHKRQHTGHAYLAPALARPNLQIETNAEVTSLCFAGNTCHGVTYQAAGETKRADADRTILSAGALRSPALLMRAGIGPPAHLEDIGIPVRIASEGVGQNLHDHMLIAGHNYATPKQIEGAALHSSAAIVYAASSLSDGRRDIMLNMTTNPFVMPPLHSPATGFKTTFSFTKPKSRGALNLASADPLAPPLIDHNIFADPIDIAGTIEALDLSRSLLGSDEFDAFSGVEQNTDGFTTDATKMEMIIAGATSFGHHCGTCKMGHDDKSVVDEKLRVRGMRGLYVVDASIIPDIPSSPTNALVIAMAELAADRFKS